MSIAQTLNAARPAMAAFAAMGLLWGTFAAVLPDLKAMLGVDEARLGFLMLFTPLAAVLAMLLAPAIGARLGAKALPVSAALMAMAFMLPGQASAVWLFPLAMMACGAMTGLTDVLMNARTVQIENERGVHLMNLTHAAYSFGYAGGAISTGFMRGAGWAPWWVTGVMGLVAFLTALACIERDGRIHGLIRSRGAKAVGLGLVPVVGGGMVFIAFLTENAAESWSALHIEETLGGSPQEGAMGPAVLALTMGFARLVGQGLTGRIGPYTLLKAGAVVAALGAVLASQAGTPFMAYAGFIVMGIGASVIAPTAFSLVGQLCPEEARARAIARATLIGYFGYFVGPPGFGFVAGTFGLRFAFICAAIMLVAVFILVPFLRRAGQRA